MLQSAEKPQLRMHNAQKVKRSTPNEHDPSIGPDLLSKHGIRLAYLETDHMHALISAPNFEPIERELK
jgi:hypothetical protein